MENKTVEKSSPPPSQITFRPLSDGLGFHPFSDGLPYAPTQTGAASGGLPRPVFPRKIVAPSSSVAAPAKVQAPLQVHGQPLGRFSVQAKPQPQPPIHQQPQAQIQGLTKKGFGYLFRRVLAYVFDSALSVCICAGLVSAYLAKQDFNREILRDSAVVLLVALFVMTANWLFILVQEVAFGSSVGKRIFGLAIQGSRVTRILRGVFFGLSIVFLGIGLLMAVFDSRKRCWHDRVFNLQPSEI